MSSAICRSTRTDPRADPAVCSADADADGRRPPAAVRFAVALADETLVFGAELDGVGFDGAADVAGADVLARVVGEPSSAVPEQALTVAMIMIATAAVMLRGRGMSVSLGGRS